MSSLLYGSSVLLHKILKKEKKPLTHFTWVGFLFFSLCECVFPRSFFFWSLFARNIGLRNNTKFTETCTHTVSDITCAHTQVFSTKNSEQGKENKSHLYFWLELLFPTRLLCLVGQASSGNNKRKTHLTTWGHFFAASVTAFTLCVSKYESGVQGGGKK